MPPVTPLGGLPKVAVVFAHLIVDGVMHGVRTFVVHLTDGAHMCPGVSTALLPQRPGCRPLDHAVTSFNHVRLSRDSLLGEINNAEDKRMSFFREIHRVNVGGLALSLVNVPALKAGAYLAYTFSQQRMVINPATQQAVSVLSFPTQYGPIISAAAHAVVIEAAGRHITAIFQQPGTPQALRQALVGIFKATATYATQRHLSELTDRCGWRGLFGFNKISELQLALKGNSIAEGDVMVLCISRWNPCQQRSSLANTFQDSLRNCCKANSRFHLQTTQKHSLLSMNADSSAICRSTLPETIKVVRTTALKHSHNTSLHEPEI